ncbi:MAG: hypothetical protein AB3N22_12675 [Ruegeria sp.]
MSLARRILMVGGTVSCALGTGYLMQYGLSDTPSLDQTTASGQQADDEVMRELEGIVLTSATPQEAEQTLKADLLVQPEPEPVTPEPARAEDCAIKATAEPVPMASVALSVAAPCNVNERLTVHHSGLMFTDVTDAFGRLDITVPALSETAVFILAFENNKGTVARTEVADLDAYDRVALQWKGPAGFQMHALEFGAAYGQKGHVWAGTEAHGLGQVARLGTPAAPTSQLVEIYTFPSGQAAQSGTIALTIEAEVTADNCGRDINAQSFDLRDGGRLRSRDLVLSMPDCGATGDFLVLNNLVEDLKIAAK